MIKQITYDKYKKDYLIPHKENNKQFYCEACHDNPFSALSHINTIKHKKKAAIYFERLYPTPPLIKSDDELKEENKCYVPQTVFQAWPGMFLN